MLVPTGNLHHKKLYYGCMLCLEFVYRVFFWMWKAIRAAKSCDNLVPVEPRPVNGNSSIAIISRGLCSYP